MSTREEFAAKLAEQEAKLREAKKLLGGDIVRDQTRRRVQEFRKRERDISIPKQETTSKRRRTRLEKNVFRWLAWYLPTLFPQSFTSDQRAMVEAILRTLSTGGDQAIAAPRGGGKTTVAIGTLLFAILIGRCKYALLIAATGPDARRILENLKSAVEECERLHADYPEECYPILALEGATQKKNTQTYDGARTRLDWSVNQIAFPKIAGSRAAGALVRALGIDQSMRGAVSKAQRPDFILVDDPETRDSADSEHQIAIREKILDRDISGLIGRGKHIGKVVLCTIQNSICLAFRVTDRNIKPAWIGERFRLLVAPSENPDLCEEYIRRRQEAQMAGDPYSRAAHHWYVDHRQAIEEGTVVSDPHRAVRDRLPDGSPVQVSTFQFCLDWIADRGEVAFRTEFQNDPPPESRSQMTIGLTPALVERRISGMQRGELPPACKLVIGLDLGKRAHHWVALAARAGAVGNIIDYGVCEVAGNDKADMPQQAVDLAIVRSLLDFRDQLISNPYTDPLGEIIPPSLVLVDSGSFTDAAYEAIRKLGEPWRACKGIGSNFRHGQPSATRRVGNHWFSDWHVQQRIWLHLLDTIHWKRTVHERFLTDPIDPAGRAQNGSLTLFVPAGARDHHSYARHMLSEEWIVRFEQGKGEIAKWVEHSDNNHYLDATAMALAGAEMLGLGLFQVDRKRIPPNERRTLRQVAEGR